MKKQDKKPTDKLKPEIAVGLTTRLKKGKKSTNYKLAQSPFPDGKTSYIRRQGTVAPKKSYTSPRKGKMTKDDHERAKIYGARAKQKYIEEKKRKKNNDVPNAQRVSADFIRNCRYLN